MSTYCAPEVAELDRAGLARLLDHTLLKVEATPDDVAAHIAEGQRLGVFAVCISPSMLPVQADGLVLATVCGFPSGKHLSAIKAAEAAAAVDAGADEVDMVIDIGAAKGGEWLRVRADIEAVRAKVPAPKLLKVIIESAVLTDEEIVAACQAAELAGADYVKTSTGFHPAGGASTHAVQLMSQAVGPRLGVKASGGIRTTAQALEMVAAGATRLGVSGSVAILDGMS